MLYINNGKLVANSGQLGGSECCCCEKCKGDYCTDATIYISNFTEDSPFDDMSSGVSLNFLHGFPVDQPIASTGLYSVDISKNGLKTSRTIDMYYTPDRYLTDTYRVTEVS